MRVKIDAKDLQMYEVQLGAADKEILPEARKVVAKGSLNIKTDARRLAPGGRHTPNYPATITYETAETKTAVASEIGPEKDKTVGGGPFHTPGNLGNILEFGSPNSPPKPHLNPAGDLEEPRFVKAMEDLAARLLEQKQ